MNELMTVQEVRTPDGSELVGFELTAMPGGQKLLLFADQARMPGFRIGDNFVPSLGQNLQMGKRSVFAVEAAK